MNVLTPDLGVEKAELSEWLVAVGDTVSAGQSLLLAESSKASMEIPSPQAGTVKALLVQAGATIKEGVPLLELAPSADSPLAQGASAEDSSAEDSNAKGASAEGFAAGKTSAPKDATNPADTPRAGAPDPEKTAPPQANTPAPAAQTIAVPDLGVDEASVAEWLVAVGDSVSAGQSLLLAESSKASMEIPSPVGGTVTALHVQAGHPIHTGDALLDVQTTATLAASTAAPAASPPQSINQSTATDQPAPMAAPASTQPTGANSPQTPLITTDHASNQASNQASSPVYAGPAVRKLARQMGIALAQVEASLPNGRLLKEDLYRHVSERLKAPAAPATRTDAPATGLPPLPDVSRWGGSHTEPLSRLQQAAIVHLAHNQFIPQVTQFDQADITDLEALRQTLKDDYKKQGISLTILAFVAKALAHLLREEPRFNSHLQDGKTLLVRDEIHLGIAVATEDGLIVPVLRQPDQKGIRQIAAELQALGQKARDKKLGPADLAGATMTITSLGALGGTAFTPLVSWPEVAILGISPAALQPVWDGQAFAPRLLLPLSLSYDHRVINGADAARFTRKLALLLADLRRVLL